MTRCRAVLLFNLEDHLVGEPDCSECYLDQARPCSDPACTGLIHSSFFDESWDSVILIYKCDVCGSTDEPD